MTVDAYQLAPDLPAALTATRTVKMTEAGMEFACPSCGSHLQVSHCPASSDMEGPMGILEGIPADQAGGEQASSLPPHVPGDGSGTGAG